MATAVLLCTILSLYGNRLTPFIIMFLCITPNITLPSFNIRLYRYIHFIVSQWKENNIKEALPKKHVWYIMLNISCRLLAVQFILACFDLFWFLFKSIDIYYFQMIKYNKVLACITVNPNITTVLKNLLGNAQVQNIGALNGVVPSV